jgi:hypothetical protein
VESEDSTSVLPNHITEHDNDSTLSTIASSQPAIHLDITIPEPYQKDSYDTNENIMAIRKPG